LGPRTTQRRLIRYLPHAFLATCAVTAAPVALVYALEHTGHIDSTLIAIALGLAGSIGMAAAGSWLWARHPGARDLVFGDLLLWGFLRRIRTEKTIPQMIELLDADSREGVTKLSPKERIATLKKLASSLEATDPYTHGHTERVARHAYMIARTMDLPISEVEAIRTAAAVHDVGKIHVPDEVLNKPGKLTDEEFALMKEHSAAGAAMVRDAGDDHLTALVRHHHERIDGKGYPDGLAGDAIPLGARIIAVADTFDAITSTRSYRTAKSHRLALDILKKEAGTQLDPVAVKAFLSYYAGKRYRAWWASLTTIPQRLLVRFVMWLKEAGVAQLANAAVATGAAVAVGGSVVLGAPVPSRTAVAETVRPIDDSRLAAVETDIDSGSPDGLELDARERRTRDSESNDREKDRDRPGNDDGGDSDNEEPGDGDGGGGDEPGDPGNPPPDDGGGTLDDVTDTVNDTLDGAKDTVDDVVDGAKDTVDDVVDGAKDTVDDVVDGAKDTVDDVLDGTKDTVDDLLDVGDSILP
jgi:hypothetical protein